MPYHIDEENSELVFEVKEGNKLVIKLKSNIGGGGSDIYLIKVGDVTNPKETNTFSSLRILYELENLKEEILQKIGSDLSVWEIRQYENGEKYISTKYDVVSEKGITAYAIGKQEIGSIVDAIPFDNKTIQYNTETGLVEVISGASGDNFNDSRMWELLLAETEEQINKSHITNALVGYATEDWVNSKGFITSSNIKDEFVTISTEQEITAIKNFVQGLTLGGSKRKLYEKDGIVYIEGNLAVSGGITQYAIDEVNTPNIDDIVDGAIKNNSNIWMRRNQFFTPDTLPFDFNGSSIDVSNANWNGSFHCFTAGGSNSSLVLRCTPGDFTRLQYRISIDLNRWAHDWRTISYTDAYNNLSLVNNVYSTGEFFNGSDARNKNISERIESLSVDDIVNLPIIKFRWNNRAFKDDGRTRYGTIAQNVQEMFPELIYDRDNSLYLDYAVAGTIFSISVAKSLKGTQKEVEKLKERIILLESMLNVKHNENEESCTLVN